MRAFLIILLASGLLAGSAFAKQCSEEEAKAADGATDALKTWPEFYTMFLRYGHCDDGAPGEGFLDSVVHLLAAKWNSLPQAAAIAQKDPAFRAFMLRHIDETTDADELRKVKRNANAHCPKGLGTLCKDIHKAASSAYRNL